MAYDKRELEKLDEKITNMEYCYGPSLLLYPGGTNSSRLNMGTQNQKQFVSLINPDIARVQTGHERAFGKYSHAYKDLEGTWKVVDKIVKFDNDSVYTLVLYNEETDTYDMVEKHSAHYIGEKFGYGYNTEFMDKVKVDDVLKDPILYKSTSYDDNMNYRLGKNALIMYSSDVSTYEDGIKIRKGFLDQMAYYEVDRTEVSINDNDILLFMHGDKSFPDVGEEVMDNDILCATRRYNSMYATYDFRESNVHRTYTTDKRYYIKFHSVIYDIDVYYNGDGPIPDTIYNKQVIKYHNFCSAYADKLLEVSTKIKNSGSHYTDNVTLLRKRVKGYTDPKCKFKHKDKAFSNILIIFKTKTVVTPREGCKIVGRYGDKGVVSKICDDDSAKEDYDQEEFEAYTKVLADMLNLDTADINFNNISVVDDESMPYTEDGTPVDILLNATGAFRRLNTEQLYEVDLNFMAERHRQWICTLPDDDTKIREIFKFIRMINKLECDTFLAQFKVHVKPDNEEYVLSRSKADKEFRHAFVQAVEKDGYYFIKPNSVKLRYEAFEEIYKEYADIMQEYQLYVNIFGMKKPLLRKAVIGYKYMYLLKQTSNKNFSARSTGTTTKAGLPTKSSDKKENRICNSNTPVCISELSDLQTQIPPVVLAEHNVWTRTSIMGRKSLGRIINASGDPMKIGKLKLKRTYCNENVYALKARLKVMGIGYNFVTNATLREERIGKINQFLTVYNYTFFDMPINRKYYVHLIDTYNRAVREGADPNNEETWSSIMSSMEIRFLKIPSYIVNAVHEAIYSQKRDEEIVKCLRKE